jgi:signal transduction histidine kinase
VDDDGLAPDEPEPDPAPRRGASLRLQVVAWLLLINALVFVSGGLWLRAAFNAAQLERTAAQEDRTRIVFDDLMSLLRDAFAAGSEINVKRILEDPTWRSVADAMIVDKSLAEIGGEFVHFGVSLNPVGAARRGLEPARQVLLAALSEAIATGEPVEVAGGRALQIQDAAGIWGAFWYRMPSPPVVAGSMFGKLFPWFLVSTLLLTGGSYLLLARLALEPLHRLASGVRRLEAGDLSARVAVGAASPAFGDLMRGLNALASEGAGVNARLEEEVRRATLAAREAEQAALIQRRLAAMGELTAGLAHEINNPLGGLLNAAGALAKEDLEPSRRARYLGLLTDGLERIRDTVSGLLRFTPRETAAGPVDLVQVACDSLALVRHRSEGLGVELRLAVDGKLQDEGTASEAVVMHGSRNELGQALLNLLGNALDAFEEAGRPGRIDVGLESGGAPSEPIKLVVSDDGPGVEADVLERAADLFFTTKEVGKGTGLGLGIVHRIVDAHGGRVQLSSAPGEGFRVSIELPRGQAG